MGGVVVDELGDGAGGGAAVGDVEVAEIVEGEAGGGDEVRLRDEVWGGACVGGFDELVVGAVEDEEVALGVDGEAGDVFEAVAGGGEGGAGAADCWKAIDGWGRDGVAAVGDVEQACAVEGDGLGGDEDGGAGVEGGGGTAVAAHDDLGGAGVDDGEVADRVGGEGGGSVEGGCADDRDGVAAAGGELDDAVRGSVGDEEVANGVRSESGGRLDGGAEGAEADGGLGAGGGDLEEAVVAGVGDVDDAAGSDGEAVGIAEAVGGWDWDLGVYDGRWVGGLGLRDGDRGEEGKGDGEDARGGARAHGVSQVSPPGRAAFLV